jgi:Family of unknown function (DUF6325)
VQPDLGHSFIESVNEPPAKRMTNYRDDRECGTNARGRLRLSLRHGGRNIMTETTREDLEEMGPIDYVVIEFPESRMTGEGLSHLVDLVDRGIIRILDFVFVTKKADGSVRGMEIADFDADGQLDLAVFEGASSGLIDEDDINEAGGVLSAGSSAGILVFENVWAAPFATAVRRAGGQLVASGRIPVQALLAAVDAAEARAEAAAPTAPGD